MESRYPPDKQVAVVMSIVSDKIDIEPQTRLLPVSKAAILADTNQCRLESGLIPPLTDVEAKIFFQLSNSLNANMPVLAMLKRKNDESSSICMLYTKNVMHYGLASYKDISFAQNIDTIYMAACCDYPIFPNIQKILMLLISGNFAHEINISTLMCKERSKINRSVY